MVNIPKLKKNIQMIKNKVLEAIIDDRMIELLKDLWGFMKARKKFWLAPIIIILLLLGALIVLSQGSAVAPFIYTLF